MKKRLIILLAVAMTLVFFTGTVAFASPMPVHHNEASHVQSSLALLKDPGISAGTISPAFSQHRYAYRIRLAENVSSITFTPVAENSEALVWINGVPTSVNPSRTFEIGNGRTRTVFIKVRSSGRTHVYSFVIKRDKSTNNLLASLGVSAGVLSPAFDPAVLNYTLTLDEFTPKTTIKATLQTPGMARATFLKKTVYLEPGQTRTVTLKVRSQSSVSKSYVITVVRQKSTNANLRKLVVWGYDLVPVFDKATMNYTVTLPANIDKVVVSARADGYRAKIMMDGIYRHNETVILAPGETKIVKVVVTAQDGVTTKEYSVSVIRSI